MKSLAFQADPLRYVLNMAYHQAMSGKGKERHADDKPFLCQAWHAIVTALGDRGVGFLGGQAMKKMQESQRMDKEAAIRELIGAINYISMAVIEIMEEK